MGEGRVGITAERAAAFEPGAGVEAVGRVEERAVAGFEAEAGKAAVAREGDEVAKHGAADTTAQRGRGGAHRLDLAMATAEVLQGTDAEQDAVAVAQGHEADRRVAQAVDRQDVARLRRRVGPHLGNMVGKELLHVGSVKLAVGENEGLIAIHGKRCLRKSDYGRSMLMRTFDIEAAWKAFEARDRSQDGRFVVAVKTTGIYCKPSCPARRPRRENVEFYGTASAARGAGYRSCLRCKPDDVGRDRKAVAEAVRLIETSEEMIPLDRLAAAVGYATHHFQRLFTRDLGVSPAAYARSLRAKRATAELTGDKTVTEAIYDAGYNAPSRFYADAKERMGMAPSAWREGGRGETIRFTVADSPIGPLLVAATAKGICTLSFEEREADLRRRFPNATILPDDGTIAPWVEEAIAAIGTPAAHDLPIDVQGTAFQEKVWRELRKIPPGETRSYADIAAAIGDPKATRAVGTANGANPVAVLVPCHRVIRSDGSLGGYAGGLDRKRKLLAAEGASWKEQASLDL